MLACLLDEDLAETALPKGIVLQVELVKAVEDVLVCMHVQGVHIEIIPAHCTPCYQMWFCFYVSNFLHDEQRYYTRNPAAVQ